MEESKPNLSADSSLDLENPLAVIDTESTGLNPDTARIVKLSVLIINSDRTRSERSTLVNPGIEIPAGATAVHGITDEDVQELPPFKAYARALADALENCDLAGFGVERFHIPLLLAEFKRAGVEFSMDNRSVIDVMSIYHRLEPRDFDSAYVKYVGDEEPPERTSEARAEAILRILEGQLESEPILPRDPKALGRWARGVPETAVDDEGRFTYSENGQVAFNFGKHSGETLAKVTLNDPDYVAWVASNHSFSKDVRSIATEALRDANETSAS